MGKLLNSGRTGSADSFKDLKKRREEMIDKWDKLGFLDNLTGHVKENIIKLYESQASTLIKEDGSITPYSADTIPMPLVRRVFEGIPEGLDVVAIAKPELWYIYIVECSDGTLYTGITNNVNKRLRKHNNGTGAKYTRGRAPVVLKGFKECSNKSEAAKEEYRVKKLNKLQKLKLIKEWKG